MIKIMGRKFFLILALLFFSFTPFMAQSDTAMTLPEIDSLIKDTNYDAALIELNKFITENPDKFDSAQARIKKIMQARNEYTVLANLLIQVILNEPENNEKILSITHQLETLERHPSDKQLAFIRDAKLAAEFNYYKIQFNRVHSETAALAAEGNYTAAVEKARSGFYMYKNYFDEQYKGQSLSVSVEREIANIDSYIADFKNIQNRLASAKNAYVEAAASGDAVRTAGALTQVQVVFSDFARIRNLLCSSGTFFGKSFDEIKKSNPDLTDASFLPFVMRFVLGKTDDPYTGILGAMDSEWNAFLDEMKHETCNAVYRCSENFARSFSEADFTKSGSLPDDSILQNIRTFASYADKLNALYALLNTESGGTLAGSYPNYILSVNYVSSVALNVSGVIAAVKETAAAEKNGTSAAPPENPAESELKGNNYTAGLFSAASAIEGIAVRMENSYKQTEAAFGGYRNALEEQTAAGASVIKQQQNFRRSSPGANTEDVLFQWPALETSSAEIYKTAVEITGSSILKLWKLAAEYYAACGIGYAENCTAERNDAQKYLDGILNENTGLMGKYPQEALDKSIALTGQINSARNVLVSAQRKLDGAYKTSYADSLESIAQSINILDSLKTGISAIEVSAREQIRLAAIAKNEADLRLSQVRNALRSEDFETARRRLQEARTKYNESLSFQESVALRNQSDSTLEALSSELLARENEKVVSDVRNLKNRAKQEYYNGNFEGAENLLNQAKSRWAVTNIEEDAEITNLMAIVESALSMKTGRIIPPTAPLYPEMSQILSIASQYYKQGSELIKKGNKERGTSLLNSALQKLEELQLVYPLNQEASLLTLRIQQILNSDTFDSLFARRVNTAREEYKNAEKQQQAYTDLLDLYEINPNYPGLNQLIYDVEIAIGVRQKPVDRTDYNRSRNLTSEAQTIVNSAGRDEVRLRQALSKVDEAIRLNPDNDAAMLLKDKIQISIGGKAAVILSSEDEAKYQQAIQELQKNNIITANAIVEQLLQKVSNRRSSKILDLQRKVKALL